MVNNRRFTIGESAARESRKVHHLPTSGRIDYEGHEGLRESPEWRDMPPF